MSTELSYFGWYVAAAARLERYVPTGTLERTDAPRTPVEYDDEPTDVRGMVDGRALNFAAGSLEHDHEGE